MKVKTEKEQCIASLKWCVVNLGETEKNTFPHALKHYIEVAIAYIEKSEIIIKKVPVKEMHVQELSTGKIATITGVYESDDEVWMVSGNDVGVFKLSCFWEFFKEVHHD